MDDPILSLRLGMLAQNVDAALHLRTILENDLATLAIDGRLRQVLCGGFTRFAAQLSRDLEGAGDKLRNADPTDHAAVRACWDLYGELEERHAQLHREFLEALVGLTVRRAYIKESLCAIADALVLKMNNVEIADTLTFPVSREAGARTFARLVRMRFPEWSIWSLPLVAFEFAHVAIEDNTELKSIAGKVKEELLKADPKWSPNPANDRDRKRNELIARRTNCRVCKLLADAFAVYTMGPSYACSLILLRLNATALDSASQPRDAERAAFLLDMMRLDARSAAKGMRYSELIALLEREWNGMIQRRGVAPMTNGEAAAIATLARTIEQELSDELVGLRYGSNLPGGSGWNTAIMWSAQWAGHSNPNKLPVPENINASSKLYDALNAAWAYRLFEKPNELEPVATVTRELCERIIEARDEKAEGGAGKGGR